jgi:integrase
MKASTVRPKNFEQAIVVITANPITFGLQPGPNLNNLTSALRQLARMINKDPAVIPLDPLLLGPLIEKIRPRAVGYSKATVRSCVTAVRRVQRIFGWVEPSTRSAPISERWCELVAPLPRSTKLAMESFARWAATNGIEPDAVTAPDLERYIAFRKTEMKKSGRQGELRFVRSWTRAQQTVQGWPAVPAPVVPHRDHYGVRIADMPEELRDGLLAYVAFRAAPVDPTIDLRNFKPKPKIRRSTAKLIRETFEQYVGSAVRAGIPLAALRSLHDLVARPTVTAAIQWQWDRGGGQQRKALGQMVMQLVVLGQTYLNLGDEEIKFLKDVYTDVAPDDRDGSPKVRERLAQFDRPENRKRLFTLPGALMKQADRMPPGPEAAELAMIACAITIAIRTAFRVSNIAGLHLDRHIAFPRGRKHPLILIQIPADEVKNDVDLEKLIEGAPANLILRYLDRYRRHLPGAEEPWLFPGENGRPIVTQNLSYHIRATIRRETDLDVNPHLFRTICASFCNEKYPHDLETPRQILGHRSLATTASHYLPNRDAVALRTWHRILDDDLI